MMAKSRNRSRDARKRAAKKRKNRLYQEKKREELTMIPCPICNEPAPKLAIENNGCCVNCWLKQRPEPKTGIENGTR